MELREKGKKGERVREGGGERNSFLSAAAVGPAAASMLSPFPSPTPPVPHPSVHYVCNAASEYEHDGRTGSTTPNAAAVHRKPDNEPDTQTHTIAARMGERAESGGCNPH